MTFSKLPPLNAIKAVISYDPSTGEFRWLPRGNSRFDNKYAGSLALTANSAGYRYGIILGQRVAAHRLAYFIASGGEPAGEVDHINGDRSDNRADNLRVVSASANRRNARLSRRNTSGVVGVRWRAVKQRWCAFMTLGEKFKHLGYFTEKSEAIACRKAAEAEHGFHPNHGRRA